MKRSKSKDKPESREEDTFQTAFGEMCKSLDRFGPGEVLHILTANSHHDPICRALLLRFPTTVAIGDFLRTLRTVKVSKRLFKKLEREHSIL